MQVNKFCGRNTFSFAGFIPGISEWGGGPERAGSMPSICLFRLPSHCWDEREVV